MSMTPPTWTHGDEALWHAYACAAMAGGDVLDLIWPPAPADAAPKEER